MLNITQNIRVEIYQMINNADYKWYLKIEYNYISDNYFNFIIKKFKVM